MLTSPSRTTAYPAAGRLRSAVIQLTCFLGFGWTDATGSAGASVDEVDGGEQADPDDVDEVPVVGHDDRADLLFPGEALGGVGTSEQEDERDEAAGHVQEVEPGGQVEHRAVVARRERHVLRPNQILVLVGLPEDE